MQLKKDKQNILPTRQHFIVVSRKSHSYLKNPLPPCTLQLVVITKKKNRTKNQTTNQSNTPKPVNKNILISPLISPFFSPIMYFQD